MLHSYKALCHSYNAPVCVFTVKYKIFITFKNNNMCFLINTFATFADDGSCILKTIPNNNCKSYINTNKKMLTQRET